MNATTEQARANPDRSNQAIPLHQGLAYVVMVSAVMLPCLGYFCYGSSLFGRSPLLKLLMIAGCGGGLGGALFGGRRKWLTFGIAGLVAGVGAAAAHVLYTTWFDKTQLTKGESMVALIVGALPGWLLHLLFERIARSKDTALDGSAGTQLKRD